MNDPIVQSYLIRFREGLSRLPEAEQEELVKEISNHIAEAVEAGQPVAAVLAGLGPAERLARAYVADAFLEGDAPMTHGPVVHRPNRVGRQLGLILAMGLPVFIVTLVLGGMTFGFAVGGAAAIVGGIAAFSVPWLFTTHFPFAYGTAQTMAIIVGLLLLAAAWGCYRLLRWFLQMAARMFSEAKVSS